MKKINLKTSPSSVVSQAIERYQADQHFVAQLSSIEICVILASLDF